MKRFILALLLGTLLLLSGCGALLESTVTSLPQGLQDAAVGAARRWSDSRWSLQDPIDAFFAAVDARDPQAIRDLFSPNVQAEDAELDQDIQALLDLYPGPTEDCRMRSPVGASQHIGWGKRMNNVHNTFPVVCGGVSYYCAFSYTTRDEADPGNVGLTRVVFATEKVQANDDYRQSLDPQNGLTVLSDCLGDYETRRIGDSPYIFTPADQPPTREELLQFLRTEDRWDAFTARFGPPNATTWHSISVFYELAPADGQPRYAHLYLQDDDAGVTRLDSVYLLDGREPEPLETLWENVPD